MRLDKQKSNWIVDAVLFGGFLLALALDLTGVALHQWLGVAIAALAGWHLAAHGIWVKTVTARFFGRTSGRARLFYTVDAALAVGLLTISVTGLVISTWADLTLTNYAAWSNIHVAASLLTLALLVAKIGLHWRWIVNVSQRRLFPAPAAPSRVQPAQPAAVAARVDRREFVKLMGVVGVAAMLAGANVLGDRLDAQAEPSAGSGETTRTNTTQASTSSTSSCVVRCRRGCSYPGHCRRYVDSNGNGRCDLGECLS